MYLHPPRLLPRSNPSQLIASNLLIAVTYVIATKLSLELASLPGKITAAWLPAGFTLAAVWSLGIWALPGIILGAIAGVVRDLLDPPPFLSTVGFLAVSLSFLLGECLQPILATVLIKTLAPNQPLFSQGRTISIFILAAIVSPFPSAMLSVTAWGWAGMIPWSNFGISWIVWGLGAVLPQLLFTPPLLLWQTVARHDFSHRRVETVLVFSLVLILSWLTFAVSFRLEYLLLPILIWVVFRLGQFRASLLVSFVATLAIIATARGQGPFVQASSHESLLLLQSFTAVCAVTTLVLSAVIEERQAAQASLKQSSDTLEQQVKERTAQLQHSQAQYRAIVEDQTELIARFLPDTTLVYVNVAFCRYFGLNQDDMIGKSFTPIVYDSDRPRVTQAIQSMSFENPTVTVENRVIVDGHVRWTQWVNRMLFDRQRNFVEFQMVGRDITDRKQAEEKLQASLREKEILLKEVHHRVKNNLQIIYSLLRLQQRTLKDPQATACLLDSQNRIEAIALIHEKLYQTDNLAQIDFREYIASLVENLHNSYNTRPQDITVETEVDKISLDINKAIPCGLIINELVSNALKYAFPNRKGHIQVKLHADEHFNIRLTVKDNGIGLPKGFNLTQSNSLGLQLVHDFVDQLRGKLEMDCSLGTTFEIAFLGS